MGPFAFPVRVVLGFVVFLPFLALAGQPREGVHFERLPVTMEEADPIIEVFSFGCHYCYDLEVLLSGWAQANSVPLVRIPFFYKGQWQEVCRLYLALEQQRLATKENIDAIFHAIHEQDVKDSDLSVLVDSLDLESQQKVSLLKSAESKVISRKQEKIESWLRENNITSIPTLIVNGKYYSDPARARGNDNLIMLVDYLHQQ